jgi:hypothetical protein
VRHERALGAVHGQDPKAARPGEGEVLLAGGPDGGRGWSAWVSPPGAEGGQDKTPGRIVQIPSDGSARPVGCRVAPSSCRRKGARQDRVMDERSEWTGPPGFPPGGP